QGKLERTAVSYDDYAVKNYTVYLKKRPINASEHTGQVNSIQREQIEKDFKNPDSRLNCIVATPTLELGVDIGKLDMVTMANVPPTPANYDQRAGRAGRRQRIATVMVYCGKTAHDLYYYDNPPEMIRGEIQAPRFSLTNLPLIQKHLHSLWTTTLQRELKESDQPLFDNYLPRHIGRYFAGIDWLGLTPEEEITMNEDYATSLRSLLKKYESALREALNRFLSSFSHEDKRAFSSGIDSLFQFFTHEMPKELNAILNHLRKRYLTMKRERIQLLTTAGYSSKARLIGEVLNALKEESLATRTGDYYTLSALSEYGFFPGYALQKGGTVMVNFEEDAIIEIDRPYALGLREFAPVSRVYALGKRFTPSKYQIDTTSGFEGFEEQFLVGEETIESVNKTVPSYERPGSFAIRSAHLCDGNLKREGSIGDDENRRSIVSYDIRGLVQDYHLGGKTRDLDGKAVKFCRKDRITLVNTGLRKRIAKSGYGFLVCFIDGSIFTETEVGLKEYQRHMDKLHHQKVSIDDAFTKKILLHTHFVSDWLSFGPFETRNEAINWMESFRLGMEFVLENGKESWD
ncbi:MAG TPA: helicase-related protein, partial [Thermotogota bacterium]|nr:helicase-related protein [Thermotogota bacterium]